MGATWNIPFKDISLITSILNKEVFIDKNFKPKKKISENKDGFEQIVIDI